MTAAQAQRAAGDLIAAGYDCSATQIGAGDWQVSASSPGLIDRAAVDQFAAGHGGAVQAYQVATSVVLR